jgi:hypothetical protein
MNKRQTTVGDRIYQLKQELLELESMKFYPGITDKTPLVQLIHPRISNIVIDVPKKDTKFHFYTVMTGHHMKGTDEYLTSPDIDTVPTRVILLT